jgi:cytochrome P450
MIEHPECQEKMHNEIRSKIGNDRLIEMSDRVDLPYTCAVMNETLRVANLLPLNLPHKTLKDVKINGFSIPKNTIIIPQISTVLYGSKDSIFVHFFRFRRHCL